ncbi:MAG: phosphotransferase [Micropruina sp.]
MSRTDGIVRSGGWVPITRCDCLGGSAAASLIENEQRHLPVIAEWMVPVQIPVPVVAGSPDQDFPWPWSVVPWFAGDAGLKVARAVRSDWAEPLATCLGRLHATAPNEFPANPYLGVPLTARHSSLAERLVRAKADMPAPVVRRLEEVWGRGLAAEPWRGRPIWIHGDLHPGNILADHGRLVAIIDFGDVTDGDPAYDLAIAWLAFDTCGRAAFGDATNGAYDQATWDRAHA